MNAKLFLAIDDTSLPLRKNLCLYLSKPTVRAEPVLVPNSSDSAATDNVAAMFYGTVLHDGGIFRMWYHACHSGMNPDWSLELARQFAKYKDPVILGPVCYAESDDGIAWRRPKLGQLLFKGSRDNNAIDLPFAITAGVNVIKDEDDPDPSRRYKMVYQIFPRYSEPQIEGAGIRSTVATAVSPDGLHWKPMGVPFVGQFIEQSVFYKHDGKYIIHYQAGDGWGAHFSEGGAASGRQGLARYSYDFDHWIDGYIDALALTEPQDPSARGSKGSYDHNHLGVGGASFGNVCVGLYGLWHNKPEFHDISCDFGLAVSNDGLVFREPAKGHVFLASTDSPAKPSPNRHYHTNLCQSNGIFNIGNETRIYHCRWRNTGFHHIEDYYGEIALATLPRDRWGALGLFPNADNGTVWSVPFEMPQDGCAFSVNGEGLSGMIFELTDAKCRELPDFSGEKMGRCNVESGLDAGLTWSQGSLAALAGSMVRVKVNLRKLSESAPRLFAINISS